jgi:predicted nucleic acid-binding protein
VSQSRGAVHRIAPEILSRARQPFPEEPIRALDALHIASALHARTFAPNLAILSFDDRIRRVGTSLGFEMLPT